MEKVTDREVEPDPRVIRIINNTRLILFLLAALIFISAYLPQQIASCNQTLNQTPNYVENATCYCKGNVGISIYIGQAMIRNTTWYQQFGAYQTDFFNTGAIVKTIGNATITMVFRSVNDYLTYYYPIEWSNVVNHEIILPMFANISAYSNLEFPILPSGEVCFFVIQNLSEFNQIGGFSEDECNEIIQELIPGFDTNITLRYSENYAYQEFCKLDYCQISYCSTSQQITMGFFVATVLSTIYTALRVVKFTILWFLYKKYRIPSTKTIPLV